jgi:predicted kinase
MEGMRPNREVAGGAEWRPPAGRWQAEDGRAMLAAPAASGQPPSLFAGSERPRLREQWRDEAGCVMVEGVHAIVVSDRRRSSRRALSAQLLGRAAMRCVLARVDAPDPRRVPAAARSGSWTATPARRSPWPSFTNTLDSFTLEQRAQCEDVVELERRRNAWGERY